MHTKLYSVDIDGNAEDIFWCKDDAIDYISIQGYEDLDYEIVTYVRVL